MALLTLFEEEGRWETDSDVSEREGEGEVSEGGVVGEDAREGEGESEGEEREDREFPESISVDEVVEGGEERSDSGDIDEEEALESSRRIEGGWNDDEVEGKLEDAASDDCE